jgi:hypothetical protein
MLNNSEFIIEIRGSGGEQERRMFGFGSGGFESWKTISL